MKNLVSIFIKCILVTCVLSVYSGNVSASAIKAISIDGIKLGMNPSQVKTILETGNFQTKSFNSEKNSRIISNMIGSKPPGPKVNSQRIDIYFSENNDKNIVIMVKKRTSINPEKNPSQEDIQQFNKEMSNWKPGEPVPVPKPLQYQEYNKFSKIYLKKYPKPFMKKRKLLGSNKYSNSFKDVYIWDDLAAPCIKEVVKEAEFAYRKTRRPILDECPKTKIFATIFNGQKIIESEKEGAHEIKEYLADLTFKLDLATTNNSPARNNTVKIISKDDFIISAISKVNLALGSKTCGFNIGYRPSNKSEKITILKRGAYKARGNKFNGIKYIPVEAKIIGNCVNTIGQQKSQYGLSRPNIVKNPIPFSNVFSFIVYKNDYDEWVATQL